MFANVSISFDYICPNCNNLYRVVLPYLDEKISVCYLCSCKKPFSVRQKMAKNNELFIIKVLVD